MTVKTVKERDLANNGKYMTWALGGGGFLRTPKNPPGYGPAFITC